MLFADNIIVYTENAEEPTGLQLEWISELASLLEMCTNTHIHR